MEKDTYNLAVIGSGPGGYVAAIRAAQLGLKTVCIEKGATLGGTCLNVGCIPSKALLQSTEYLDLVSHHLSPHGLSVDNVKMDFSKLMQRKEDIVKGLVSNIPLLFKGHGVESINGSAKFVDTHSIEIKNNNEKKIVSADNFLIATGSEPVSLPFLPFDETQILSSTGALSLNAVPQSMLIIGAGAIGLELASVYNRLGTKVTVIEMMDRVSPAMDLTISKQLQLSLKKQGFEFYLSTQVISAKKTAEKIVLEVLHENQKKELSAEKVLVAVGRRPFTQGLGLEEIGVAVNSKGFVAVDGSFRASKPHIYAIGDVIEGPMLAHKASEEGTVAVELIAGLKSEINYLTIPNVIYTHPEAASVGFTEKEAREAGLDLKIGTCFFKGNPRARCSGETDGLIKIIGESSSGKIMGVHIIGAHASELIQSGVYAIQMGMTLEEIARTSHAHPTFAESMKEAALQALKRAIHN